MSTQRRQPARRTAFVTDFGGIDDIDPLTDTSGPGLWSRANIVEAVPGVVLPAGWSFYGRASTSERSGQI